LYRLYVSSPTQTLQYVAIISHGKKPSEIAVEDGIGNADFNAGLKKDVAAYAYEILQLYELRNPLPLKEMQRRYKASFPQRYAYVSQRMLDDIAVEDQIRLF
jgi:predicted transcriptional regulator